MTGTLLPLPSRMTTARNIALCLALAMSSCVGKVSGGRVPQSGSGAQTSTSPGTGSAGPVGNTGTGSTGPKIVTGTGGVGPGGVVTSAGGTPGGLGNGGSTGSTSLPELTCPTPAMGPSPLRRLTHREYDNAVADLLGDKTGPSSTFPPDTAVGLFDNSAEVQTAPVLLASEYVDAALTLVNAIPNLTTLAGCDFTAAAGTTCVQTFIARFGRRAYRRPVTTDETTRLVALFNKAPTDKPSGMKSVIAAMLVSPNFLFRPEFGSTGSTIPGAQTLTQFEVAGRLASLLWASVPDDTLLDEAQAGRLGTPAQVATQARRMLTDTRARRAVAAFYEQWLGLAMLDVATKDTSVYQFDDQLRDSMRQETQRFVENVIWSDDGRLSTLLQAPYSFVNAPLATLYGVKGPADALTYSKVMFDSTQQRFGLLTQASFLAAFARPDSSSPVKRGAWIRKRLLCGDLPDPPNVIPELPEIMDGVSNRDRFAMHVSVPGCAACHKLIDGLGFGLEAYDGVGRYRTMDRGLPVDANGEITSTVDIDGKYNGAQELSAALGRSAQVQNCAPTQWLRYAMARRETADDSCALKAIREGFAASGGNLKELMVTLTQTDAFMNYKPAN